MKARVVFILALTVSVWALTNYTKVVHSTNSEAKCLDGSTPALYIHKGSSSNILIYLKGEGTCFLNSFQESAEDCLVRSKTQYGSSLPWPDTFSGSGKGILETNTSKSKFASWTKIIILQCDGSIFQGYKKDPLTIEGTNIYNRGSTYMKAHFQWINSQYSFNSADKIVLAGSGVGGAAVILWLDYLRGLVSKSDKVLGISDSDLIADPTVGKSQSSSNNNNGFNPIENPSPDQGNEENNPEYDPSSAPLQIPEVPGGFSGITIPAGVQLPAGFQLNRNLQQNSDPQVFSLADYYKGIGYDQQNKVNPDELPPNTKCFEAYGSSIVSWMCLLPLYSVQYLQGKTLWIESNYDSKVLTNRLELTCQTQGAHGFSFVNCKPSQLINAQVVRSVYYDSRIELLIKGGHSVWAISCSWHAALFDSQIYDSSSQRAPFMGDNRLTIKQAVQRFVFNGETIVAVDKFAWPSNRECAF